MKNFQLSNEFLRYFHNTSWMFFDKVFKMALGFFVFIYITRYLGPDRFGMLSYAQSIVSIFVAVSSLGLANGGVLLRELVKNSDKRDMLLGTVFHLTMLTSFMAISTALGVLVFLPEDQTNVLILIMSFSIIFQNVSTIIIDFFQFKVLSKYVTYCSSIGFLFSSILKIALIYFKLELIFFAYALLFDSIILSVGLVYIYKRQGLSIAKWKFDLVIAKKFLKALVPLTLVTISAFLYTRIDQIMIKHMLNNEAVGNYAAAITVSELFYFIPAIILTSIFPKIVAVRSSNKDRYMDLLENLYRLVLWVALPIAVGMYFFSDLIVSILYGSQYTQASEILAILSWSIVFSSVSAVFIKMLYIEGFEKKYLYKNLFGVVINTVLNYFLIKEYGAKGAAIATLFTLFAVSYIFDLFDKELRKFYYLKFISWLPRIKRSTH